MKRVLAVCLGNICRSPAAEAAIRSSAEDAGIVVEVDSAGTAGYHVGEAPDVRMRRAGSSVGLRVDGAARQVMRSDFDEFDVIVAMDRSNFDALRRLAPTAEAEAKVHLFRSFDPTADGSDVPDPYYGTDDGFRDVIDIVRAAADGLIGAIEEGRV